MKKAPLYSRSRRGVAAETAPPPEPAAPPPRRQRLAQFARRHERRLWALAVLVLLAVALLWRTAPKGPPVLTFEQIDHLVRKSHRGEAAELRPRRAPTTRSSRRWCAWSATTASASRRTRART